MIQFPFKKKIKIKNALKAKTLRDQTTHICKITKVILEQGSLFFKVEL